MLDLMYEVSTPALLNFTTTTNRFVMEQKNDEALNNLERKQMFHINSMISGGWDHPGARVMMGEWLRFLDQMNEGRRLAQIQYNAQMIWSAKLSQLNSSQQIEPRFEAELKALKPRFLSAICDVRAGLNLFNVSVNVGQFDMPDYEQQARDMDYVMWCAGLIVVHGQMDVDSRNKAHETMYGAAAARAAIDHLLSGEALGVKRNVYLAQWERAVLSIVDQRRSFEELNRIAAINMGNALRLVRYLERTDVTGPCAEVGCAAGDVSTHESVESDDETDSGDDWDELESIFNSS